MWHHHHANIFSPLYFIIEIDKIVYHKLYRLALEDRFNFLLCSMFLINNLFTSGALSFVHIIMYRVHPIYTTFINALERNRKPGKCSSKIKWGDGSLRRSFCKICKMHFHNVYMQQHKRNKIEPPCKINHPEKPNTKCTTYQHKNMYFMDTSPKPGSNIFSFHLLLICLPHAC